MGAPFMAINRRRKKEKNCGKPGHNDATITMQNTEENPISRGFPHLEHKL
jgi:hypothetical protein